MGVYKRVSSFCDGDVVHRVGVFAEVLAERKEFPIKSTSSRPESGRTHCVVEYPS